MVEMDTLAQKIFSLLKGNGFQIKIFDNDGNEVTDPSMGRRFFIGNPNIMVTINEDDNSIEFSKGKLSDDDSISAVQKNIRKLADEFMMNSNIKVFGKAIQPRDYAYQAKIQKEPAMMENTSVQPYNHQLLGQVYNKVKYFKTPAAHTIADDLGMDLSDIQPMLNRLVKAGKITARPDAHGDIEYSVSVEEAVMEVSTQKLSSYKTAAGADARQADKAGDTKRADKRFSGIVKATNKQFANDAKKVSESDSLKESFSKMFGSLKTSHQVIENVRILVRHNMPVSEEVRGSRSRHISAIFLECNGERMRFQHNYLPGARAMAQHMAHGGSMADKVGAYISESTDQLLKLQSFNRYVTTNKLINEDSSSIIDTVKENIQTLRTELKKLTGAKTYETVKARLETFEREALAEDDTSQLKDLFTIRRFDEKFEEVLPIVKQLVQEKNTYHKRIEEAAGTSVVLRREAINTTPMFEFASENARLGFKLNELALRILENDELAGFINKIGTKLCKEGLVNSFEKAILSSVLENAILETTLTDKKEIKESTDLDAFFDRYTMNFF